MKETHLSIALRQLLAGESAVLIAAKIGVSQSTLSRLMNEDRRVDVATLKALCSLPRGLEVLVGHLRDEVARSGAPQHAVTIDVAGRDEADDMQVLLAESQTNEHVKGMLSDLASAVRRRREWETNALAAEPDQTPYGKKKK